MDNDFKQFAEEAKKIKLSDQERILAKKHVLNFISENPVRPGIQPRLDYQSHTWLRGWSNIFLTNFNFVPTMAILLILAVLVTGGVAVGAEKALPGDVLYQVKVGVNERVRGMLATSDEAKADWEIRQTERRLEEAEALADEGSLNASASENIEANFEAHVQRVRERVEKFRNKENFNAAASVSLNFETSLKAHERILAKLADRKDKTGESVKTIRTKVSSEVRESVQERERMDIEIKSGTNINDGAVKTEGSLDLKLGL